MSPAGSGPQREPAWPAPRADPTEVTELHAIITALHDELLQVASEVVDLHTALAETNERLDFAECGLASLHGRTP